jgi:hypothetical protein
MDSAAKERLIARISWGHIPATVRTQDGKLVSFLLRSPTPKEQAQAAMVYSTELQRAAILGLSSEKDILANLITLGQWSSKQEEEIEGLQKDIRTIRRGLLDFLFNRTKLEKARSLLRRAEEALVERCISRHNLLTNSAESQAEICQQRYLIGQIAENENGERFWPTTQEFNNCQDIELITQLCEAFFQKSRVPIVLIRELARSQQWRPYWEITKNTNDLFENPIVSWSLNQRELAYWSTIYDSVYGAYERPSSDIIEDDDLLDSWFIRQGDKIDNKTQKSSVPQSNKPGRNESFIMSDQEGAKRVYAMNDPSSRAQIRARQKVLNQRGSVKEQNMPDSQREMRQQLVDMQRKHVKDIRRK